MILLLSLTFKLTVPVQSYSDSYRLYIACRLLLHSQISHSYRCVLRLRYGCLQYLRLSTLQVGGPRSEMIM
ncbi:hypothetical protein J3R30DRAFT_3482653 [Lentinula aciculospora]|uniref:Uncharacterized protein n=1 Tax=Lentinula aciculospora TaxID=153920 RepID=A0A9W9AAX1_9AGAR|nr:hypothetical protein J3R30DRAFT_3482653 [Lentinula aciculospora]